MVEERRCHDPRCVSWISWVWRSPAWMRRNGTGSTQAEHATETLERVLQALPQGTVLFSADDEVVYANPSALDLLGAVPVTLSGLAPFPFQNAVRECREHRQPVERVADHGKPVRRLRALATPFSGDDRILLIVVDVTDLDRVASIRRDFVANASHELKTPVSAIIASSEALQIAVERKDDSSLGFAQQIERSARQLDRLVGDLLDLSRLEREQPELEPLSLDLLVREEMERLRPVADEKQIEVTVELAPAQIAGSRRDIAIAVRNLLDNAVRYTGSRRVGRRGPGHRGSGGHSQDLRHRRGDPDPGSGPGLRALLSRRRSPFPVDRGHRSRPRHRQACGRKSRGQRGRRE